MSVATGAPDPNDPNWKWLLSKRFIDGEREVRQTRAQKMGMAFVDLDRVRPDEAARSVLPAELARELRVLPVKRDGNTLWLAMDGPDMERVARVRQETGLRVIPVICVPSALDAALETLVES